MTSFVKNGYMVTVERDLGEPLERFTTRGYFVAGIKPATKSDYNEAVLYSRIYANHLFLKTEYHPACMETLNELIAKSK